MSIRHEQLKQNVEITRQRLDHARVKRLESVRLHKRHKVLNIVFWTVAPVSAAVISFTFAWWVILIWAIAFGFTTRIAWKDLITARDDIHAWRKDELKHLSHVTDDIQALVERETLQLMDPEAYARIESPPVRVPKERGAEYRAAQQLKEEIERKRERIEEKALTFQQEMRRLTNMQGLGMPSSYSPRNEYVTKTTSKYGKVVKQYINVDTGNVDYERVERW